MVILHFKQNDLNQFLFETSIAKSVDEVLNELCTVNALRIKIDKLAQGIEGLADHGPLKLEALRGLTTQECIDPAVELLMPDEKKYAYPKPEPGQRLNPDKTGYRIGIAPPEEVSKRMIEECAKAKDAIHVRNIDQKKCLTIKELAEIVDTLRGMVMIAYPAYHGLYEWDHVYLMLEEQMDYATYYPDCEWKDPKDSVIWACRKEWISGKMVKDYIPNEKTKMVIKIAKAGTGQPVAEPPIDKETHSKMMAYYYKKQEEMKKLEQDEDDAYMNSDWANPNNLKNQLMNQGKGISWKPGAN